jgi:hypothetical protein
MDEVGGVISKELVLISSHSQKNVLVVAEKEVNTVSGKEMVPFVKLVTLLGVNEKLVLPSSPNEDEYRPCVIEGGLYKVTVLVKSIPLEVIPIAVP